MTGTKETLRTDAVDEFLFALPTIGEHASAGAAAAIQLGALASRLVAVERTRCVHPDGRAENDAEHSFMLAMVAPELAHLLYPGKLNTDRVARLCNVHDTTEGYVGDTPTDVLAGHSPAAKKELEARGAAQMLIDFAHMPDFCAAIREYEAQETPESRFTRAVDKLMVLLIHLPNKGATMRQHYTYESFLKSEAELLERDAFKYGEFVEIMELRREIGKLLADTFLADSKPAPAPPQARS